jgi:hypothetical protein
MKISTKRLRSLRFVCAAALALAVAGGLPASLSAAEPQQPDQPPKQPTDPRNPDTAAPQAKMASPPAAPVPPPSPFAPEKAQSQARMANPAARAPVAGALVSVELQPKAAGTRQPVVVVAAKPTDANGTLQFRIPEAGTCRVTVDMSRAGVAGSNQNPQIFVTITDGSRSPISIGSKTGKNPLLYATSTFDLGDVTRTYTLTVTSAPAAHDSGISGQGIK